jgi:hypothetical protein
VTYCHRRCLLYWNHQDCAEEICPVASEAHGSCQTCRHQRGDETCALTNAPLPQAGGCCHWNVTLTEGLVQVTPGMVAPLAGFFEATKAVLADFPHRISDAEWVIPAEYSHDLEALGITYRSAADGLYVDPERLMLVVEEPVADILDRLDAPYQARGEWVWVDPDDLALPLVYGRGYDVE